MKDYLKKVDQILEFEPDPAFARRARIIFENLNLNGKEKVLEVGCGRGFYLNALSRCLPELEITGVDLNQKYLDLARGFISSKKVKLFQADATKLPFKNNSFDRIIAAEILEHIWDDQKAIFEVYRVLRPGGIAMVTVPNKNYPFLWDPLNWLLERIFGRHIPSDIWWLAGIWAAHVRLYEQNELKTKFQKAGFEIEKTWLATHYCFPFSHFLLYGIGRNLIERGFLGDFNRFAKKPKPSFLRRILLWPVRQIDKLNKDDVNFSSSMNLVFLAVK